MYKIIAVCLGCVSMSALAADPAMVEPVQVAELVASLAPSPVAAATPAPVPPQEQVATANEPSAAETARAQAKAEQEQAWGEVLEQLLPNSPGNIREYRAKSIEEERASAPRIAPREAASQALTVSLEPGAVSPRLTILHGFVMAIEVLDKTGQPWPIIAARTGDETAWEINIAGAQAALAVATAGVERQPGIAVPSEVMEAGSGGQGNVVTISARKRFHPSNLLLMLQGESRPVSVMLLPAEATASSDLQDRVTLLVSGQGPLAKPDVVASYDRLEVGDDLRRALVGVGPTDDATEILATLPSGMRAWTDTTTLWLRTPEQVVSPAPQAGVSMGNMRAYRMPYLPSVVLLQGGRLTTISVRGTNDRREAP